MDETHESSANVMKAGMVGAMSSNLLIQFVLSSSLQTLWGMINTLQFIVHLPLLNIDLPDNAFGYMSIIIGVLKFLIFDPYFIHEKVYGLTSIDELEPINDRFYVMQYKTKNVI